MRCNSCNHEMVLSLNQMLECMNIGCIESSKGKIANFYAPEYWLEENWISPMTKPNQTKLGE